jgi:uncharacterized protein YlaI
MSDNLRLLICRDCRTIEELPDFDGPPEHDVLLDHLTEAHVYPNGEKHFGNLAVVPADQWRDPSMQQAIVKQISSRTTGLESEFYATKNTYEEDALKCFKAHHRPKGSCGEFKDERKRLGNPHKELAANWRNHPFKVYLCDFCPVKTWVDTQERAQAGLYKEN